MKATAPTRPGTVLPESELVLGPNGEVYHLGLHPEQVADLILVMGDPGRVAETSKHFDRIDHKVERREFVTHTGEIAGKRITALATGIGTDNIDIVLNELDALVNIDLKARTPKANHKALTIIRMGTCGALQKDIPVDRLIISTHGLGLDNVLHYYANEPSVDEEKILSAFNEHMKAPAGHPAPYIVEGDSELIRDLAKEEFSGITATASGFYGPQGRRLRLSPSFTEANERMASFGHGELRVTNYEMETSALYGLSALLGHKACTVCTVIANRDRKEYSADHHAAVEGMIKHVLGRVA